jgi:2-polyprenyl-3-methyl-5-hydroxy-6-metoxy-1,4-benzoquinol methylase
MFSPASVPNARAAAPPTAGGIPMVPREKVEALVRYRLLDPLEDIAVEYAEYAGKPVVEVLHEVRYLAEHGSADREGQDVQILPVQVAQASLPHVLTRLQIALAISLQFPGATFLDIGAGTGRDCIAFARCGIRATHADVPWEGMAFAEWRYAGRGLRIPIVDVRDLPDQRYTIVNCHDVFEHVEDPLELLAKWVAHTEPGGILCVSLDLFNPLPTHLPKNDFYATLYDPLLRNLGMELVLGHTSAVCDVTNASLRIYKRARPAMVPAREEVASIGAEANAYAARELRVLHQRLEAECERVEALKPAYLTP